jgi:hypothetical protein
MTASKDAHISAELEAWATRVTASPGHAALAAAYESGEAETLPAAYRGPEPASQSQLRHLQRGRRHSQRSPDRQRSEERRRRLAWSGSLPGYLAGGFTIGNMAVAWVVADEHLRRKFCALSIDEIAARAGVTRKTAKRALKRASSIGLITIEERPVRGHKNRTNLVKIESREWLEWLENRSKRKSLGVNNSMADTLIGGQLVAPTNTNEETAGEKGKESTPETLDRNRLRVGEVAHSVQALLLQAAKGIRQQSHHIMTAWRLRSQIDGRSEVHPDLKSSRRHRAWRKHQANADADRPSAATSLVERWQAARLSDCSPPSSSWTGTGGATGSEMQGFAVRGSISGLQRSAHQQRKVSRCQS